MERGGCGRLLGLQSLDRGPAEDEHHARDLGDHIRAPTKPGVQGHLADHRSGSHGIQPNPPPVGRRPLHPQPTRLQHEHVVGCIALVDQDRSLGDRSSLEVRLQMRRQLGETIVGA